MELLTCGDGCTACGLRLSKAWEGDYSRNLVEDAGFVKRRASPSLFFNPHNGVRLVVWGGRLYLLGS